MTMEMAMAMAMAMMAALMDLMLDRQESKLGILVFQLGCQKPRRLCGAVWASFHAQ
jgi:hypothetical protein